MVTLPVKDAKHLKASSRIVGLAGIKEDLNTVCDMCLKAAELMDSDPTSVHAMSESDLLVLQALYTSAMATYARCFNGGPRTRLEERDVRLATGAEAEVALKSHRLYLAVRDRHLAHSINSHEEGILGIVVDGDPLYARDLTVRVFRQTVWAGAFHSLWSLADLLLPVVNNKIDKAMASARAQANLLTPEELDALPEAEFIPPGAEHLTDRRGDPRSIPESGAWGYVLTATYPDEPDEDQPAKRITDGPDRHRKSIMVTEPDEPALWRDLGHPR